jgi:cell division transport system ATP-binding protein
VIQLQNVACRYGGQTILSDVTLDLPTGSFHFLTGPSGAGKTTFARLCYGALKPSSGKVRVLGSDMSETSGDAIALLRRRIGVVHQDCRFLDHLSVAENILLPLVTAGRDSAEARDDLAQLLAWVGLTHRAEALPPELSGGERQRAALARGVILSPDILIADEPTGNIDWEMSQRLLRLLVELHGMGKTILVATHDLSLIRAAKTQVEARVLRIANRQVQLAGATL